MYEYHKNISGDCILRQGPPECIQTCRLFRVRDRGGNQTNVWNGRMFLFKDSVLCPSYNLRPVEMAGFAEIKSPCFPSREDKLDCGVYRWMAAFDKSKMQGSQQPSRDPSNHVTPNHHLITMYEGLSFSVMSFISTHLFNG